MAYNCKHVAEVKRLDRITDDVLRAETYPRISINPSTVQALKVRDECIRECGDKSPYRTN